MADNANEMMEALSKQLRMPPEQIRASCERGDTGALLEHVDGGRAKQVESILSDPAGAGAAEAAAAAVGERSCPICRIPSAKS